MAQVARKRRGIWFLLAALGVCVVFLLTQCNAGGSKVTISYGDNQTATGVFESADCTDTEVFAVAVKPRIASLSATFDDDREIYSAQVKVYDEVLVLLQTEDISLSREGNTVSVSGKGTVKYTPINERNTVPGESYNEEDVKTSPGSFEATIQCSK
ncbi:hypothetical protein [Leucobacter komagatae]|uniref:Lipoprotein n=1 Tax=Leucobacter komagatae TaxID=55969 RepID=A0A0D0IM36_9MICO|nr:hypothetical protein [Leucobacter komagatae]KIP52227.1 hypothetical protein SD72_10220 [Leucobacter komagatae]